MGTRQRLTAMALVVLASVIVPAGPVPQAQELEYEYAAKIVCGVQRDPKEMRLARGFYATTINVHNPNAGEAKLFKKLALTIPPGEQRPGDIKRIAEDVLKPDQALATDCMDILRRAFGGKFPTPYIEGFVVIQSATPLDVTAVYTTAAIDRTLTATQHSGIHVEQIRERRRGQAGLADLIPVPNAQGGFCNRQGGQLLVTVRNQGVGPAGPSSTRVDFATGGSQSAPTPALAPGASTQVAVTIPTNPNCFSPDCRFRITVDAALQVTESNEANNVADGFCLG